METEHAIKETTNCDSIGGKVKDKKKKLKKQAVWLAYQLVNLYQKT